mmetsp:Transcript_1758/g.2708  ORF Transcript_1758/g.2708 Transcript_1758/m.2708 type:complete len:269 (-) Transcript_1758:643-1449(-)
MTFINVNAPLQKDSSITTPVAASTDATETNENIPNITCNKMKRGAFLVLEGVDRCGKTTQCSLLLKHLVQTLSLSAIACRFPDRTTPIGQMINAYLLNQSEMDDRAIHLLFSANRWEASKHLCQQLASGTTVVCDRYAYSGVAFSAAKEDAGLSLDWCKAADIGLPAPDAVIFLDICQEEAEKRGGFGGERYEKRDMQIRVRKRFADLQALEDSVNGTPWYMINAQQSAERVHSDIQQVVQTTIDQVNSGAPLRKLWLEGTHYELPDC